MKDTGPLTKKRMETIDDDIAERAQETGKFRPPDGDAYHGPLARQFADDMAPEKPGAAENRNDALAHNAAALPVEAPI